LGVTAGQDSGAVSPESEPMFSAGPGGAWSHEASHAREAVVVSNLTASHAVRPGTRMQNPTKVELALRKKNERANTTALLATLELLVPNVDENKRQPGNRCKALRGRAKDELLKDVMHAVRLAHRDACATQVMALGALQQAYTTQAGAGLIAIEMNSGAVAYQSPSFQDLLSWVPEETRGNIRVALWESRDGDDFHSFCESVVRDAGEPYGETFLDRDKVVGTKLWGVLLASPPDKVVGR